MSNIKSILMEFIKFGVIGCGNASNYHILGIKEETNSNIKFVSAIDINERNLNRVAKCNKLTPYTNLDK